MNIAKKVLKISGFWCKIGKSKEEKINEINRNDKACG